MKKKNIEEIKMLRRQGLSYNEIAERLKISVETVSKAVSKASLISTIWDGAELMGCGKRKKEGFEYDLTDEYGLRLQKCEDGVKAVNGVIPPVSIDVLRCFFDWHKNEISKRKSKKE